jgi:23S rRNA (guanosine2251-2'-O)-methyltransferase
MKNPSQRDLKDFISATGADEKCLIVALDSIHDPQNLGSIFRAAECFGANALLSSHNRGAPTTPVVSKVSSGASELVEHLQVANLIDALRKLKEANFWIVAANVDASAQELGSFDFPARSVILLGSEGEGIQPLALKNADFSVYIRMLGRIDSLNVSQASAVFLSAYRSRHPLSA